MAKSLSFALAALLLLAPAWLLAAPRVITLSPANTELAFAAGITPVGVSSYSDYPSQAKTIEQVASWQGMNLGTHRGAQARRGAGLGAGAMPNAS